MSHIIHQLLGSFKDLLKSYSACCGTKGSEWWGLEFGIRGAEGVARSVLVGQFGEILRGMLKSEFLIESSL